MFTDARISSGLDAMIRAIAAPPVPLAEIQRKLSLLPLLARPEPHYARLALGAAAAIAAAVIALPTISPAFVQTIGEQYRAALQALGGIAPSPAPAAFVSGLLPKAATLAMAQSRVRFTIVAPDGLPKDIISAKIWTTPTGVYSKASHSWSVGPPAVTFSYQRAKGRSFQMLADRFDPRGEMVGKYMFEAQDPGPDGRPVLVKHERFAWRNGDQIMTAVATEDISPAEIDAIRVAMHGVSLPRRELHAPNPGTSRTLYRIFDGP
jgi:hypothetical protein